MLALTVITSTQNDFYIICLVIKKLSSNNSKIWLPSTILVERKDSFQLFSPVDK